MNRIFVKLNIILLSSLMIVFFGEKIYAAWGKTSKGGIYWANDEGTYEKDGWRLIDEDGDGIGYYYYFNENGFILLDDITPDYKIVDKEGKRLTMDGEIEIGEVDIGKNDSGTYLENDVIVGIDAVNASYFIPQGIFSSGNSIINVGTYSNSPKPSDGLMFQGNIDGTARTLLAPGVVLTDKNKEKFDTTIDKDMSKYVKSSSKFSEKVNGQIFTKQKWKEVMALKGTGATVVFENPKNNFNKLKGRIATHYFTYTDRTTKCTLYIYDNETDDELAIVDGFDYNGGKNFECTFFQSTNAIRFELDVEGQYPTRTCYLRGCEFGFDRETWEEEEYEREERAERIRLYGTASETVVYYEGDYAEDFVKDEDEEDDEAAYTGGEMALEGESPFDRYNRLMGRSTESIALFEYDEEDDSVTEAMKASMSEIRKKMEADDERRNRVSGPAFDKRLKDRKESVDPLGNRFVIPAGEATDADD